MQNTGEDFGELLGVLTEDELQQYGRVALDQIARLERWFVAQVVLGAVGVVLAVWGVWRGASDGFTFGSVFWLAPGALALYWFRRSVKSRQLWREHCSVVNDELARREEEINGGGASSS